MQLKLLHKTHESRELYTNELRKPSALASGTWFQGSQVQEVESFPEINFLVDNIVCD
jgi:hypothetical protein